jgi:hypothetical protein
LPIKGEMGARYKKFGSMANRCLQFYIFLHVLYSIIEGVTLKKSQIYYELYYKCREGVKIFKFTICYAQ